MCASTVDANATPIKIESCMMLILQSCCISLIKNIVNEQVGSGKLEKGLVNDDEKDHVQGALDANNKKERTVHETQPRQRRCAVSPSYIVESSNEDSSPLSTPGVNTSLGHYRSLLTCRLWTYSACTGSCCMLDRASVSHWRGYTGDAAVEADVKGVKGACAH